MRKTLYDVLEVPRDADAQAIEGSHQRLRDELQRKADAGDQDSQMRLVAVREAYQTLSDHGRRRIYDASINLRERQAVLGAAPARERSDGLTDESRSKKSAVIKGLIALGLVAISVYGVISYREAEAERIRAIETRKQAIEMEKLAIERARVEVNAAAQRQRELNLELQKQRQEEVTARAQAEKDHRATVKALLEEERNIREKESDRLRRSGDEQLKQQLETADRERKLNNEKAQLRKICEERYGRPDC